MSSGTICPCDKPKPKNDNVQGKTDKPDYGQTYWPGSKLVGQSLRSDPATKMNWHELIVHTAGG
jgi:hypothetical protein